MAPPPNPMEQDSSPLLLLEFTHDTSCNGSNGAMLQTSSTPAPPPPLSSIPKTFANLMLCTLGTGVLSLPYTFSSVGWANWPPRSPPRRCHRFPWYDALDPLQTPPPTTASQSSCCWIWRPHVPCLRHLRPSGRRCPPHPQYHYHRYLLLHIHCTKHSLHCLYANRPSSYFYYCCFHILFLCGRHLS